MLQNIRDNVQGPWVKVIVWLIVTAFAAFGIESILLGGGTNSVAEVNGEPILPSELQQSINNQKRQLISIMGDQIDPAMLEDERLQAPALEALIGRKLVVQAATDMGLAVSERELGQTIAAMEQFQIDGQFSADLYREVLTSAGFTPASFKQTLLEDVLNMQLRSSLGGAEFVTPQERGLVARLATEQRDLRYLTVPLELFRQSMTPSETEILEWYELNNGRFMRPESVDLEYVIIDPQDLKEDVSEEKLAEEYELESEDARYQTESRVSHILLEAGEGGDADLQQRLDAVQAALAAGGDFAEVAREFSDDIGSSNLGGDLGFTAGDAFPEEMEAAIAELEPGQVSGPVITDAGTHILLVTERRKGEVPTLEELRSELTERIQLRAAKASAVRRADQLRDLAFTANDLSEPAEELGLEINTVEDVTANQTDGLFANESLLSQAFSEDVLELGHNSEVVELSGARFVALRVREYREAAPKPLEEVSDAIVAELNEEAAGKAVIAEAERALISLRAGSSVESFATENGYEWQVELGARRANGTVRPEVLARVFRLPVPAEGDSVFDYVLASSGDVIVLELARVTPGSETDLPETLEARLRNQVSFESGGLLLGEFERGLRDAADITRM